MRYLSVLTVALLVVLAGCSGAPGGSTDAATNESTTVADATTSDVTPEVETTGTDATESDVTTTTESDATTTAESADGTRTGSGQSELPPGLSEDGVTDAEALAAAHADALANRSYTHVREVTLVAANGSELGRWHQRVQVGADGLTFNFTQTATGVNVAGTPLDGSRVYTNGSVTYSNASALPRGYSRSDGRGFPESRFDGELLLAEALNGSDASVTTVERDGETRYLVRAESERERALSGLSDQDVDVEVRVDAANLTATALVAPSGFVENVTYEYDFERGNVTGHRTETLRYTAVGETTVERPSWVAEAETVADAPPGLNAAGVTDASALADAHASALQHTSYTVDSTLTARDGDAVLARQNVTSRVVHDPTRSLHRSTTRGQDPASVGVYPADIETWSSENGTWHAFDDGNGTTYRKAGDAFGPAVGDRTGRDQLAVLLAQTDTTLAGTTVENGTTLYRVNASGGGDDLLAQALQAETVENVSATILVGEDGIVRQYRVAYDATVRDVTARVNRTVRFTALGETTVERPSWVDDARETTNATDGG